MMTREETPAGSHSRAVGIVEAEGFISVFDAVEAMGKASHVVVGGMFSLGSGLVAVAVRGELAHVMEAVEVARATISGGHGIAMSSIVFADPVPVIVALADDPSMVG